MMKKLALLIFCLVSSSFCLHSQEYYACFKKDYVHKPSGRQFYAGSLQPLEASIIVTDYKEDGLKNAQKQKNKDGGIVVGASFKIKQFGATTDIVNPKGFISSNARFIDNTKDERYDVPGATTKIQYVVDNCEIADLDCFEIIPKAFISGLDERDKVLNQCVVENNYIICSESFKKGKFSFAFDSGVSKPTVLQENKILLSKKKGSTLPNAVVFYFSNSDDKKYIPDFSINLSEFKTKEPSALPLWLLLCLVFIGLCIIFFCASLLLKRVHRKISENYDESTKANENNMDSTNCDGDIADSFSERIEPILNAKVDELKSAISSIKITPIMNTLSGINERVLEIKTLVSNSDDKKKITELTENIAKKDALIADLESKQNASIQTIKSKELKISSLNDTINQLKEQLTIEGTEEVLGTEHFVSFAQHLLNAAQSAEETIARDWLSIGDIETKERASYFMTIEVSQRPSAEIERWRSILSNLHLKAVISDTELIKYVKTVPEKERASFLAKQFIDSVVRPYVSSVLVLLEQFRTGKEWGYLAANSDAYSSILNEIITICKGEGITIDYRKLYEPLNNYDTVEIDDTVPSPISNWIDMSRRDIVLFVRNYSVSSKNSNVTSKTSCVIVL